MVYLGNSASRPHPAAILSVETRRALRNSRSTPSDFVTFVMSFVIFVSLLLDWSIQSDTTRIISRPVDLHSLVALDTRPFAGMVPAGT